MKKILIINLILGLYFIFVGSLAAQEDITGSIVKIYTVYNKHSYFRPWQMEGQRSATGSGCIIDGHRILTNAHVVADATFIQVKRAGEAKKFTAEVDVVAHECELAILKVKDKSFFEGALSLEIGDLAEVRDDVATFGFPVGGEELGITEGVVSRVEIKEYTHSGAKLLSCQIDAAINPGSSGGPVIKENKVVGVAFQASSEGENIGYMVPASVIKHFLKDIEDGRYDGIPGLGISYQPVENPDMRRMYKMKEDYSGVLVNKIYPESPAEGVLQSGDVILSVDGIDVANNGTINFRNNERTSFAYGLQKKFINDVASFEILRDGDVKDVKVTLSVPVNHCLLVPHEQYDLEPSYYVVGGLVFMPLTYNYIDARISDDDYYSDNFYNLIPYYDDGEPSRDRREVVVLVTVLADEMNVSYQELQDIVITSVNGVDISTIKDLVKAVEGNEGEFHVFIDKKGNRIVLDRKNTDERQGSILEKYKVGSDRSEDLKRI